MMIFLNNNLKNIWETDTKTYTLYGVFFKTLPIGIQNFKSLRFFETFFVTIYTSRPIISRIFQNLPNLQNFDDHVVHAMDSMV